MLGDLYKNLNKGTPDTAPVVLRLFMDKMKNNIFDKTGAKVLALAKVCTSLQFTNNLNRELELHILAFVMNLKWDRIVYVNSVLHKLLQIDRSLSNNVCIFIYLALLQFSTDNQLQIPLLDPLYHIFCNRSPRIDTFNCQQWLLKMMHCTFYKVRNINGVPLIQCWMNVYTDFDLSNCHPFMMISVRYLEGSECLKQIMTHLNSSDPHKSSIRKMVESLIEFSTPCRTSGVAYHFVSVSDMDEALRKPMKVHERDMKVEGGKEKATVGILSHCMQHTHSLAVCISALQSIRESNQNNKMYVLNKDAFLHYFFAAYFLDFAALPALLKNFMECCGDLAYIRPNPSLPSLHELICRSSLAKVYIMQVPPDALNIIKKYRMLVWIMLGVAMVIVSRLENYSHLTEFISALQNRLEVDYPHNSLTSAFCNVLSGVMLDRIPMYKLKINSLSDHAERSSGTPQSIPMESKPIGITSESTSDNLTFPQDELMDYEKQTTEKHMAFQKPSRYEAFISVEVDEVWTKVPYLNIFVYKSMPAYHLLCYMHNDLYALHHFKTPPKVDPTQEHLQKVSDLIDELKLPTSRALVSLNYSYVRLLLQATAFVHWCLTSEHITASSMFIEKMTVSHKNPLDFKGISKSDLLYIDSTMFWLWRELSSNKAQNKEVRTNDLHYLGNIIQQCMGGRAMCSPLIGYASLLNAAHLSDTIPYLLNPVEAATCHVIKEHLGDVMETMITPISHKFVKRLSKFGGVYHDCSGGVSFVDNYQNSQDFDGMIHMMSLEANITESGYL